LNPEVRIGKINVPALYIWGSQDLALGETAAIDTARYVSGPYHFKKLEGRSHWLLEEVPDQVSELVLEHICTNVIR
jgi:pimeloyl-ACP methyl ester carboxylesterase